jgi:phosphoglucosamine mutase
VRNAIASATDRLGSGGRILVRPSGTEPLIRVMGEGDNAYLVNEVVDDIVTAISRSAA